MSTATAVTLDPLAFLGSAEDLTRFVDRWEAGQLAPHEWTHAAHVAVAAYFVVTDRKRAFERMKSGILRHNAAVGTDHIAGRGYNEEITRHWINRITELLRDYNDPWFGACEAVQMALAERRPRQGA